MTETRGAFLRRIFFSHELFCTEWNAINYSAQV